MLRGCSKINDSIQIKQSTVSIGEWLAFVFKKNEEEFYKIERAGFNEVDSALIQSINKELPTLVSKEVKMIFNFFIRNWTDFRLKKRNKVKYYSFNNDIVPLCISKEEKKENNDLDKYLELPITGVSAEQVESYLLWVEENLNDELIYSGIESDIYLGVRLVPVEVYDDLIDSLKNYLVNHKNKEGVHTVVGDSVNTKGCHLYNFKGSENCPSSEHRLKYYGTVKGIVGGYSYNPDLNGIYCLLGNVAEMTSTPGLAKGGNYKMYAKEILANKPLIYTKPSELIGFRYMVTIEK